MPNNLAPIYIADYNYALPNEKIAYSPLQPKDASRLLVYKNETIVDDQFHNLAQHIAPESLLIFNNSKVIPARLAFYTPTNAYIEIFILEPIEPNNYEKSLGFSANNSCTWKCFIGNVKKWKSDQIELNIPSLQSNITATKLQASGDAYLVSFSWTEYFSFAEIIEAVGKIPLPPYIKRDAIESDKITYQTMYASINGSVAAPTAGLHFTQNTMDDLHENSIATDHVTLHVGAGTFKPVKAEVISEHQMHSEYFEVNINLLQKLINAKNIVAVGTTSCRTLESLHCLGCKVLLQQSANIHEPFSIQQWDAYNEQHYSIAKQDALCALLHYCQQHQLQTIECHTQILLMPGYEFKVVDQLITNFHQPKSTLLLLIAAFLGNAANDANASWKRIYAHALENDYRFLSYGDSSILSK
jgi:S-adenosylmethionine:tRNA ribosyltransferase-isomerase